MPHLATRCCTRQVTAPGQTRWTSGPRDGGPGAPRSSGSCSWSPRSRSRSSSRRTSSRRSTSRLESMVPTLEVGDRVLVNKLSYDLHDVNRGDIVVFESGPNPPWQRAGIKDLVKRVIALPGETVTQCQRRPHLHRRQAAGGDVPPGGDRDRPLPRHRRRQRESRHARARVRGRQPARRMQGAARPVSSCSVTTAVTSTDSRDHGPIKGSSDRGSRVRAHLAARPPRFSLTSSEASAASVGAAERTSARERA